MIRIFFTTVLYVLQKNIFKFPFEIQIGDSYIHIYNLKNSPFKDYAEIYFVFHNIISIAQYF